MFKIDGQIIFKIICKVYIRAATKPVQLIKKPKNDQMKNLKAVVLKSLVAAVAVICLTVNAQAQDSKMSKMEHKKMSKMEHKKGKMSKMSHDKMSKDSSGKM
ncbi:hypothetical protein [uncultured Mucilaginibacter sp.]|uniref:hypothetical protein n=1 Tax=uncultured Mucilaginibacter sp. TaxID=797541 RepID=UPI0026061BE8|nr:hypothetical protein [uncultured Mucilaginibacter sp.]